MDKPRIVKPDRGRVWVGELARHDLYEVTEGPNGTIVLTPWETTIAAMGERARTQYRDVLDALRDSDTDPAS